MSIKLSTIRQFDRDNKNLKNDMMVSFQKANSLEAYDTFQQLASLGAAEKVTAIDTTIADHEVFGKLVRDASQTMEFMDKKLERLVEITADHLSKMVILKSSSGGSMNYPILAKNFLATVSLILNSQFDNKYVFSGEDYLTPPVADITTKSNLIEGIPTSNYYQGGGALISVVINDLKIPIEYGINADNDAFQQLIGGVHLSLTTFNGNQFIHNSAILEDSYNLVRNAATKIIELRSKLGNDWATVEQNLSSHSDEKSFWNEEKNKISGVDLVDALKELEEKLRNLESSYSALKKMNSVKFPDI